MNCHDVQSQLSAWLDGELPAESGQSLAAHLAECPDCRSQSEALRQLDEGLARTLAPQREAARRVAEGVIAALSVAGVESASPQTAGRADDTLGARGLDPSHPGHTPLSPARSGGAAAQPVKMFAAAAAGFLLAWLMFSPARRGVVRQEPQPAPPVIAQTPVTPEEPSLARLTVSTGSVEVRQPGRTEWSLTSDDNVFRCPSGTEVRTGAGVRCELETDDLCTIRLNEATELAVHSPREIELRAGQVWCSSPPDVSLQVVSASLQQSPAESPRTPWSFVCPSNGTLLSEVDPSGGCRISAASDAINVTLGSTQQTLQRGEIARIVEGQLVIEPRHADALLSTSWMQPLLVRKGHDSPELGDRVNRLLANLGRSKMNNLYEDEIRSLGDHAVLPLLRFVQSPTSRDEPSQRQSAMAIIVDVAPTWVIGDLIGLLSDDTPFVRAQAATALQRLTRQTHGRVPAAWSAPLSDCEESLDRWHQWWQTNSHRYEPREKKSVPAASPRA